MLSSLAPAAQALCFYSVFTSNHGRLSKALRLNTDGQLIKDSATKLWEGTVRTASCASVAELAGQLDSLTSDQAVSAGVVAGLLPAHGPLTVLSEKRAEERAVELQALGQLLSAEQLGAEYSAEAKFVTRTKGVFNLPTAPALCLLFMDIDDKWDGDCGKPAALADKYKTLMEVSGLGGFAHLVRASTSNGLVGVPDSNSFHLYMLCPAVEQAAIYDLVLRRLWEAGLGWISLSQNGALLKRQLIDDAVQEASRLIYAGPAQLGAGLAYRADHVRTQVHGGIPVVTYAALLGDKEVPPKIAEMAQPAMQARMAEAKARRLAWDEQRSKAGAQELQRAASAKGRAYGAGQAGALAKAVALAYGRLRDKRWLAGAMPLALADGNVVTVDDIMLAEVLARMVPGQHCAWHGQLCRDPIEPDYENGKVTAKIWTDGQPSIHSFAHGSAVYRMLISQDRWLEEYLRLDDKDFRHRWLAESAGFVDLLNEQALVARLLRGDKTQWKTARGQYVEPPDPELEEDVVAAAQALGKLTHVNTAEYYLQGEMAGRLLHTGRQYLWFDDGLARWRSGVGTQPVAGQLLNAMQGLALARPKDKDWLGNASNLGLSERIVQAATRVVDLSEFDNNPSVLGAPGCVLDFSAPGIIRANTPDDLVLHSLRVRPMAGDWGAWQDAGLRLCDYSLEDFEALMDLLASMLAGVLLKKYLVIVGPKHTGKSVFVEGLAWALGDYASTVGKEAVVYNRSTRGDEDYVRRALGGVLGRRFAYTGEFGPGDRFNMSAIKNLTGGDTIQTRRLHKDPVQGIFHGLLASVTNYLPSMDILDESMQDRIVLLQPHFSYALPNGEEAAPGQARGNVRIREILREQAGAMLWELVQRALYYNKLGWNHLHVTDNMRLHRRQVRYSDPHQSFIHRCLEPTHKQAAAGAPTVGTTVSEIYERYFVWLATEYPKVKPMDKPIFGRLLDREGIGKATDGQVISVKNVPVRVGAQDKAFWQGQKHSIRLCKLV